MFYETFDLLSTFKMIDLKEFVIIYTIVVLFCNIKTELKNKNHMRTRKYTVFKYTWISGGK